MAINTNTYGSVDRVQHLVGDVADLREFSEATNPKKSTVEEFLNDIANELNANLRGNAYVFPINQTSFPEAYGMLVTANCYGAAALVLQQQPAESYTEPDTDSPIINRRRYFAMMYKRVLDMIIKRTFPTTKSTDAIQAFSGSAIDAFSGLYKAPLFTRDITDYPGAEINTTDVSGTRHP